jgi:hypothetical protein
MALAMAGYFWVQCFTRSSAETWRSFVPGSKFSTADGVFQVREDEPAPLSTSRRQPWDSHCAIGHPVPAGSVQPHAVRASGACRPRYSKLLSE